MFCLRCLGGFYTGFFGIVEVILNMRFLFFVFGFGILRSSGLFGFYGIVFVLVYEFWCLGVGIWECILEVGFCFFLGSV